MILQVQFINKDASEIYESGNLLSYATSGSSGFDLRAAGVSFEMKDIDFGTGFSLKAGDRCLVKTGLRTAISEGFELQIRPRSGLALKNGITVLNTPGTIDSDYRGEIGVILLNTSGEDFKITKGDRIAQCIVSTICKVDFKFCEELDETLRSSGGFGSSGVK